MIHVATLWQVTLATDPSFLTPTASVFTITFLTTIPAISGLTPSTNYLARASYYGDDGSISAWSVSVPFTTLAVNTLPDPGIPTIWSPCA